MICWIIAIVMSIAATYKDATFNEAIGCMIVAGLFAIAGNISLHR